jgi:hypothetical protein
MLSDLATDKKFDKFRNCIKTCNKKISSTPNVTLTPSLQNSFASVIDQQSSYG